MQHRHISLHNIFTDFQCYEKVLPLNVKILKHRTKICTDLKEPTGKSGADIIEEF